MSTATDAALTERRDALLARIAAAARAAGRDPAAVRLIAVSKTQPLELVQAALRLGQSEFGENYAQELRDKGQALADAPPLPRPRWHFIGPLQRNKVRLVVGRAALIHTIDNEDLLREIDQQARRRGVLQPCLVQVNIGDEPQKAGCAAAALPRLLDAFAALPASPDPTAPSGAVCHGLMCIPPVPPDADDEAAAAHAAPFFRALAALRADAAATLRPRVNLRELSMGMSQDFEAAIAAGATLVRVGTAFFGPRPPR